LWINTTCSAQRVGDGCGRKPQTFGERSDRWIVFCSHAELFGIPRVRAHGANVF
jgi:hypothetical protein